MRARDSPFKGLISSARDRPAENKGGGALVAKPISTRGKISSGGRAQAL